MGDTEGGLGGGGGDMGGAWVLGGGLRVGYGGGRGHMGIIPPPLSALPAANRAPPPQCPPHLTVPPP